MDKARNLVWFVMGSGFLAAILLAAGYKMGSDNVGVALAQGSSGTISNNYCYTQQYNANGTKNGTPVWFPCDAKANLWTLNQAQQAVAITPANGTKFAPTKALQIGSAAACNLNAQLVNNAAPLVFQNLAPGAIVPFQVIDIEATSTTCTNIYGLY